MHTKLHTKVAKIDSTTVLIPYELITITGESFFDEKFIKMYEDGTTEECESFVNYQHKSRCDITKTSIKYKKVFRMWGGTNRKFIHVVITSKHLVKAYFEGINSDNIETIFEHINGQGIIMVPNLDIFKSSYVVDIDICKDFNTDINEFKALKKVLLSNILPCKIRHLTSKSINSKDYGWGLQYNDRNKATPSAPFGKLYNKTSELLNNSTDFYETNLLHLQDEIVKGIARLEFTIKASAHKKHLGIELRTLNELLDISTHSLDNLFASLVNEYYNKIEIMKIDRDGDSVKETIYYKAFDGWFKADKNLTIEQFLFLMLQDETCKVKKSRMKKELLETLAKLKNTTNLSDRSLQQKVVIDILKNIGIYSI